ncbi:response regulator transcription factor [Pseudohalioglobus lutimaris]|uniref:Two-component system response regulator n=1 Tax=Pseudohalioglobus lutimaris TaxID=1737061 RepID=A0A2N5WZ57_9GAMM|nr:response regulator [Pseudohalioglobus lutimaris]PLW67516.1 two-component system response regulator [Pseudohalioglobus lutimaris]
MNGQPRKILLVDDDHTFTSVMARGFARRGFAVERCDNATDAIAVCAHFQPTHILLDLNMPEVSGLVVLPDLLRAAPAARLVVLTGYSSIATAVEATKAGATHYLCKPAGIEVVLAAFDDNVSSEEVDVPNAPISVERLEWEHIQRILNDNDGNISATARALGMHRRTLQRKLQKRPVRR